MIEGVGRKDELEITPRPREEELKDGELDELLPRRSLDEDCIMYGTAHEELVPRTSKMSDANSGSTTS
jgi:hypothetical protein